MSFICYWILVLLWIVDHSYYVALKLITICLNGASQTALEYDCLTEYKYVALPTPTQVFQGIWYHIT